VKGSCFWLVGGDDWLGDKFDTNNGGLTAQVGGEVYRPSHWYASRGANAIT